MLGNYYSSLLQGQNYSSDIFVRPKKQQQTNNGHLIIVNMKSN